MSIKEELKQIVLNADAEQLEKIIAIVHCFLSE